MMTSRCPAVYAAAEENAEHTVPEKMMTSYKENPVETKKIAVPLSDGTLSAHFGHCQTFAILTVNEIEKTITGQEELVPPPHEPGLLPKWLSEHDVALIIAGGMGSRAVNLFNSFNIDVITGAPEAGSEELVKQYLSGTLEAGSNVCDH